MADLNDILTPAAHSHRIMSEALADPLCKSLVQVVTAETMRQEWIASHSRSRSRSNTNPQQEPQQQTLRSKHAAPANRPTNRTMTMTSTETLPTPETRKGYSSCGSCVISSASRQRNKSAERRMDR